MADALEAQIAEIRKLGKLPEVIADEISKQLEIELKRGAKAGRSPTGTSWDKNQDGSKSLPGAADALVVNAIGRTVIARVGFPYSLHNAGTARGGRVREIIPTGDTLPAPVAKAVEQALKARL